MNGLNRLACVSISLLLLYVCIFAYSFVIEHKTEGAPKTSFGVDAAIFYSAGQLSLAGKVASPYNIEELRSNVEHVLNKKIPAPMTWAYPPSFFLLLAPLSQLPYTAFLFVWLAIPATLAFAATYMLTGKNVQATLFACGYPGILMNLVWGQNGFISAALLGFGLYFVNSRPAMAGLLFGLLTYKPTMALFPLLLLLFMKKWRVLILATTVTAATSALSYFLFGTEMWLQYLHTFSHASSTLLIGPAWEATSTTQVSLYSALRLMGTSLPFVYAITGVVDAIVIISALWVWRTTNSIPLRSSFVLVGMFLVMPYARLYDLAILALPFSLLSLACLQHSCQQFEKAIIVLLWLLPFISPILASAASIQICPFVLLFVLALIVFRVNSSSIENDYK